jgi:hypothetical protein
LINCLEAAGAVEKRYYKAKKKYLIEEYRLRASLSAGCSTLRFEVWQTAKGGFKVVSHDAQETWSIDDADDLVRLTGKGGVAPSQAKGGKAAAAATAAAKTGTAAKPGAPGAKKDATPAVPVPAEKPGTATPVVEEPVKDTPAPERDNAGAQPGGVVDDEIPNDPMRVRLCYSKNLGETAACKKILADVKKQCEGVDPSGPNEMCTEYKIYSAAKPGSMPDVASASGVSGARQPAQTDAVTGPPIERSIVHSIENVHNLGLALQTVLKLRPVSFIWKNDQSQAIGFVAEEIAQKDPRLSTRDEKGIQGWDVGGISALLTGGLQELYGMCQYNTEGQKTLATRLANLEQENARLKKQVDDISTDLKSIKAKLGRSK